MDKKNVYSWGKVDNLISTQGSRNPFVEIGSLTSYGLSDSKIISNNNHFYTENSVAEQHVFKEPARKMALLKHNLKR